MILVDAAIWPWRDRLWAHLVSDASHEELHHFATSIGKRRVSFQGDHYDVDSVDREIAIEAGAVSVDSRDLVRALRRAGLRRRPSDPAIDWDWHLRGTVQSVQDIHAFLAPLGAEPDGPGLLEQTGRALRSGGLAAGQIDVATFRGSTDLAVVISAPLQAWRSRPDVDQLDVHEAYASVRDNVVTLELLTGPGTLP